MNDTAVVIVNWNGKPMLKNCLDSLRAQTFKNFEVFLVDNGSIDGSAEFVEKEYPEVHLIKLKKNTGFAGGTNAGIRKALENQKIKYLVTINNDTKADKFFLQKLVEVAEKNPSAGAVAPKMKYFYQENLVDSVGILIHRDGGGVSRGNKQMDSGQYDQQEEIFGVCAGAALYRRSALEEVMENGEIFDEIFFAYYEDLDLAWRLRLAGWKAISCPQATIKHIHSATAISYSPFKAFQVNRNRFFVILKNYPFRFMLYALAITPMRYLRLINSIRIKQGPSHKLKEKAGIFSPFIIVLKGWVSVIWNLKAMLRKRKIIQKNKKVSNKEINQWFEKYSATIEEMIYK